ncbi:hypothetical protein OG389_35485 [Streptomyces sp. NBC_00435]|uniref:hypothetical protein n=1 Tax=Streptomyces sp. NBC_00435 TaxID=2903649 RepID=UPI002E1D6CD0
MAVSEALLWDAADKSPRMARRLRRMAVAAGCLGLIGWVLWVHSGAWWAARAAVAYVLLEIAYWLWDRRRLVEVRVVAAEAGGPARLHLRRAGGRTTEYDPTRWPGSSSSTTTSSVARRSSV